MSDNKDLGKPIYQIDQKLKPKIDYIYMCIISINREQSLKPNAESIIEFTRQSIVLTEQFQSITGEERKHVVLAVLIKILASAVRLNEDERKFIESIIYTIADPLIDALVCMGNLAFKKITESHCCFAKSEPV